jgi:tetratricopeptide (TPR) repeat protein
MRHVRKFLRHSFLPLLAVLMLPAGMALRAGEPVSKPPWQRLLQGQEARKANEQLGMLVKLVEAGKWAEALEVAEALAELRGTAQGKDHWEAVSARWDVEAIHRVLRRGEDERNEYARVFALERQADGLLGMGRYQESRPLLEKVLAIRRKVLGDDHPDTAQTWNLIGFSLNAQGRYVEAEAGYRQALAIRRKALGEEHPDTATSCNNVAYNLHAQGKYAEAVEGLHKALAIRRKVLGEDHPDTGGSYNNVAINLHAQGRYAQADEGFKKALAIFRRALGEDHRATATCCSNLAGNLMVQGKHAEAAEGLRKALDVHRKVLGEGHPDTAHSYNNMAFNLHAQGKYAQAEAGFRKALAIRRQALGEEHPLTAFSWNNLALNLKAQGRFAEADEGYRKALAIFRKVRGEEHPDTAFAYNNVASNLGALGRFAEASEYYRKALDVFRQALGEVHPNTAATLNNLAFNLHQQGNYAEAAVGMRKALEINRRVLGEEHPDTAICWTNLGRNLEVQGKYAEAERTFLDAAECFARARLRLAASGLDRVTKTSEHSPLLALAAVLARNGKPEEAWQRYEESLARGTWDDLSARLRRPQAEQARQAEFVARLERLDQLIEAALTVREATPEQKKHREDLLTRRRQVQDDFIAFARHLEKTYGPAAGQVFDRQQVQRSLPQDTALVGWVDLPGEPKAADPDGAHWAVLLRSAGPPAWERLRGAGPRGAWTETDTRLPAELRATLQLPRGPWQSLAERLGQQRLGPLVKHLAARDGLPAVRHLIVLPSAALAGIPAEVIAEGRTISYALSGTLHAHLHKQPRPTTEGLLALADPIFELPGVKDRPAPLPPAGVLLTLVTPGSNAATAGLQPNDVLLRYGNTELKRPADLALLPPSDRDQRVAVRVWRDGKTFERQVRPGPLGVVVADEPAPRALAALRRLDQRLASRGGEEWDALPGTRVEVEALRRLFPDDRVAKLLVDSQASEQQLDALARSGELGKCRYVHLATHGVVDDRFPLRSALILARDSLPDPQKQLEAGLPVFDGRLTAEKVLRQWHLNSELVTLSACQTALGKYEHGEGFVGFAQALILCGTRSVCLSLWKVDDAATALLMQRFYANLLGKRDGLKGPMGKAAALREAKEWLRNLSRAEALRVAAEVSQGVERGKGRPKGKLLPPLPEATPAAKGDCPYAHPYYWAAFVLIGDPD